MSTYSFVMQSSRQFYDKLLEEYRDYLKDTTSARFALNCALNAWHLVDWVFNEYIVPDLRLNSAPPRKEHLHRFEEILKTQCMSLQVMQDLAEGTKHLQWGRPHQLRSLDAPRQAVRKVSTQAVNDACLFVTYDDRGELCFEDELRAVMELWTNYLRMVKAL